MADRKIAVVTGGTGGIGRECCLKLAQMGMDIAIIYYKSEPSAVVELESEIEKNGARAKSYACDVSDFEAVREIFKIILTDFGTVDVLVNNAGITRDMLLISMKEDDFDTVLDINLKGAFNTIKQVYPILARRRSGRIINISSVSGIIGNTGQANYSTSKAGLIGLTKSVARELAVRGVTCNAVAPGMIETPMTADISKESPLLKNIPAGRIGKPEEVASLVVFLASDAAAYITGEVIRVDGGLAM